MREHHLGYKETIRKYNLPGFHLPQQWERKYLEEGFEGLAKDNRGRPTQASKKRGRPPKLDKQVEKDLIAENQRLRMENEFLKKLQALILAEEQEKNKKH